MTNAEAIETLRANYPDACYEQLREAVDVAIEALKAQDAARDTISRQAAIDAYGDWYVEEGTEEGFIGTVKQLLEGLPPAQPEQRWIPCSEQLPKQGQEVICQCRANIIKVLKLNAYGDWYQDAEHCYMGGFVIAWMPLPEPYKGGEKDG